MTRTIGGPHQPDLPPTKELPEVPKGPIGASVPISTECCALPDGGCGGCSNCPTHCVCAAHPEVDA